MSTNITVARQLLAYARLRADLVRLRGHDQRGASAIEWAIISAIVVAAAVLIGTAITNAVTGKKDEMCSEDGVSC